MARLTAPENLYCSCPAEGAAYGLFALMTGISEELWCAGWVTGLERSLWLMVVEAEGGKFGMGDLTPRQVQLLRLLAEESGVWWTWPKDADSPECVPLDEWRAKFAGQG